VIPWREIGRATAPGMDVPLVLLQHDQEFVIAVGPQALMSSAAHGSEEALAEQALEALRGRASMRVLVGGLGMGYTLAAALRNLATQGHVVVAELLPALVEWNRGPLAHLAGRPLDDPRVTVHIGDVGDVIQGHKAAFDAILLDVDNGPRGLTRGGNSRLYSQDGLAASFRALTPGGVFGVWSVAPERPFNRRLAEAGFDVRETTARARGAKGGRHTLWFATRPARGAAR
jgi:spermidine synthase